jgi:hypothetical protein
MRSREGFEDVAKAKADEADIGLAPERIQNCARGNMIGQQAVVNCIVQHEEVPPFGRKEDLCSLGHLSVEGERQESIYQGNRKMAARF